MAVLPRSRCSRLLPLACIALLSACSGTPKPAKPPERVTGAGGSMLRYSSKQTTIELTPAERAAVDQVRVRAYPASDAAQLRDACAAALKAAGYEQVAGDAATDIVTGERHQKLVGRSREAARPAQVAGPITAPSRTTRAPTPSSSSAATAPRRASGSA